MQNRKGFTLIELLIVVVIIGILAAIAIPKFANTKEKAVLAGMKSDLRNLVTAQEAYFSDNQTYAPALGAAQAAGVVAFVPTAEQRDRPVDRDCGRLGGRGDQRHAEGHHHQVRHLRRQRYCAERRREGRGRPGLLLGSNQPEGDGGGARSGRRPFSLPASARMKRSGTRESSLGSFNAGDYHEPRQ